MRGSTSSESVVARYARKMPCVIECEYSNVISAADLEPIDSAVGSYDPRGLFRVPPDCSHQVKREKAYRSGMREDRDPSADVSPEYFPELGSAPA